MLGLKSENEMMEQVEAQIGYRFTDRSLLREAITHRSFARDERLKNDNVVSQNERLEFLGDAILSMVSALELFTHSPRADEGMLTQLRANYVCEAHLAQSAKNAGLGTLIRVSPSMRKPTGVELPSLLCDVVEALIGAVYLDAGFEAARGLVLRLLGPVPTKVAVAPKDAKTELQEWTQAQFSVTPVYKVTEALGPPHSPVFTVEVYVADRKLAEGKGPSKKDAAQNAAREALASIK
jgi:ribonuclease-3